MSDASGAELGDLLRFLRDWRGVDFTGYKTSTLRRRIDKRVKASGCGDLTGYIEYVRANPDEITPLINTVLINVTSFFRDPEAWQAWFEQCLPPIFENKAPDQPIRIWSAGCATGQEPFTAAMLLAEALGMDRYCSRVKIYATDLDDGALNISRRASYPVADLEELPDKLRDKYFEVDGNNAQFHGALRRTVIFGRHDLVEDAPISRVDLLLCRNTLMYFNAATQGRILERLRFALNSPGFLFLGRAEMLLWHTSTFSPVDLKHRIFAAAAAGNRFDPPAPRPTRRGQLAADEQETRLREAALDASPAAQLALDGKGRVTVINQRARLMFHLGNADLGKPLRDLEVSYRPVDLRTMIDQAHGQGRVVEKKTIEWRNADRQPEYLDVAVTPVFRDGDVFATTITFTDVTHHHELQEHLQQFSENLETAYEELQSANEELETTNEELQSANEELETTNEELQAANEELETINEELRSTNEELGSTNLRLRDRETALAATNQFLNTILDTLEMSVAVLDRDLQIQIWNHPTEDMWGIRSDEAVGSNFASLDIGLPVGELLESIRECVAGDRPLQTAEVDAVNRRGRGFRCSVRIYRLERTLQGDTDGVCVVMMSADRGQ